jgi:hypothetical protein
VRTTFADIKSSRIPAATGVCASDARLIAWTNEAQQRLLTKGLWHGTLGKFRICVTDGCVTLPPQLASIEAAALCGSPVRMRDMLYEFLESGYGLRNGCNTSSSGSGSCCGNGTMLCDGGGNGIHRGSFPTFRDIIPSGKKLNVICDLASDVGKEVLALGYDDNGNWIRTDQGGTIKDGELIAYAQSGGTISSNYFSSVTDLQLPSDMNGQAWLYEYKVADATKRLLSKYEYFETRPSYTRYFFPGIRTSEDEDGNCTRTAVDIIGKLEYIPVKVDTDYLIISNIPAMKAMVVAISQAEKTPDANNKAKIIASGYAEALAELNSELSHYIGDVVRGVNIMDSSLGRIDPIPTLL